MKTPPQLVPSHLKPHDHAELIFQSAGQSHFDVEIIGVSPDWVTPFAWEITLMPETSLILPVEFTVPDDATAGIYTVQVRLTDSKGGAISHYAVGELSISPYYAFAVDVQPRELKGAGEIQVAVANQGNTTDQFEIAPQSENGFEFDPPMAELTIEDGCFEEVVFKVTPQFRRLAGEVRSYPLNFAIHNANCPTQWCQVQFIDVPRLPFSVKMHKT